MEKTCAGPPCEAKLTCWWRVEVCGLIPCRVPGLRAAKNIM